MKAFIDKMKLAQNNLLEFLDEKSNSDENFNELVSFIQKENYDKYLLKSILRFLLYFSKYHLRSAYFFTKMEKILNFLKNDILNNFSNHEIFGLFKSNKRVLLILFEQNILKMDKPIAKQMLKEKLLSFNYPFYFYPEIEPFLNDQLKQEYAPKKEDNFEIKRKIGENDNFLCQLIREDIITDFCSFATKGNISLNSKIPESIYETNSILLKNKQISLIEYAAFCGSLNIVKFLQTNNVRLKPSVLNYAIHSNNPELINFLEEICKPGNKIYLGLYIEAIKCNLINIAEYIQSKFSEPFEQKNIYEAYLKYYNFNFIQEEKLNSLDEIDYFYCKYDYYYPLFYYVQEKGHLEKDHNVLYCAVERQNVDIVDFLIHQFKFNINMYFYVV